MNSRFVRGALLLLGAGALAMVVALLGQHAEAQTATTGGPLLVKMSPLPRDIVSVIGTTPAMTAGQTHTAFHVPAGRHFVLTAMSVVGTYLDTNTYTYSGNGNWSDLVENVGGTTTDKLLGSLSGVNYRPVNGIVFAPNADVQIRANPLPNYPSFVNGSINYMIEGYYCP